MKICFLLPRFVISQSGGYKMVYEYANRLARKGYEVSLLFLNENALLRYRIPEFAKKTIVNIITKRGPKWFKLDNSIKTISTCESSYKNKIKDIDIVVFTAVETTEYKKYFPISKKLYLIQDFENWRHDDDYVTKSFKMGFFNIVIAQWLKEIVDNYSEKPATLIRNPIDTNTYHPIIAIEKRPQYCISVNYRSEDYKGFRYTYEAIAILKKNYPCLEVYAFGTERRPDWFPSYFYYTRYATQKQTVDIYNKTSIFLCGSIEEGFGLTGLEAMACGTALVSTRYKGVYEYALDGINALLSPVKNSKSLAQNVAMLIDNQNLRIAIAKAGVESVADDFDWNKAIDKFEKVIHKEK